MEKNTPTNVYCDTRDKYSQSNPKTIISNTECLTLSISQASRVIGCSESFCYKLAREKSLPGVFKLGHRYFISRYQLEKYINEEAGTDG
ncbi:helix-turn-helix domain-containing protein [Chloroflexota bacterium]